MTRRGVSVDELVKTIMYAIDEIRKHEKVLTYTVTIYLIDDTEIKLDLIHNPGIAYVQGSTLYISFGDSMDDLQIQLKYALIDRYDIDIDTVDIETEEET